ncbi:M23 family metallopeptidase [Gemmiger sp.]
MAQRFSVGQVIGYVGSTGDSTGTHLHFEVSVGGALTDPFAYVTPQ